MQRVLLIKSVLVAVVFAILLLPLSMIRGIVAERATRQQAVVQDISASSFGKQIFAGPILSMPYAEEYEEAVGEPREKKVETRHTDRALRFFPTTSDLS